MSMRVINTRKTTNKSDGFIAFQHASESLHIWDHKLLVSLKTWVSGWVPWASKIWVTCQRASGNSNIFRALITYNFWLSMVMFLSLASWKWKQKASSTIILMQMQPCLLILTVQLWRMQRNICKIQTMTCFAFNNSRLNEFICLCWLR